MGSKHEIRSLEMQVRDARHHQRECAARGDSEGVTLASERINALLDEIGRIRTLDRLRARS